jgi:hypothetical protein
LDDISEATSTNVRCVTRQFENLKNVYNAVEVRFGFDIRFSLTTVRSHVINLTMVSPTFICAGCPIQLQSSGVHCTDVFVASDACSQVCLRRLFAVLEVKTRS